MGSLHVLGTFGTSILPRWKNVFPGICILFPAHQHINHRPIQYIIRRIALSCGLNMTWWFVWKKCLFCVFDILCAISCHVGPFYNGPDCTITNFLIRNAEVIIWSFRDVVHRYHLCFFIANLWDWKIWLTQRFSKGHSFIVCLAFYIAFALRWRHNGAIASQITSLAIVYPSVYSGADQSNIKAPRHWPLCGEFTGDRWIPRTNGQ